MMIAAGPVTEAITTQQWVMLGVLGLMLLLLLAARGRRRRSEGSPKQYRREIDSATAQSEAVRRDMEQLLVELETLSQKIGGQIDASLAKLREATQDADRRISALRMLIAECKRVSGESGAGQTNAATGMLDGSTAEAASPGQTTSASSSIAAVVPGPRHQRIYELADRGLTAVQIAQELQARPGEVELILNLRKVEN